MKNRKAFLDMVAHSEGTAGLGDNGYNVLVGGSLFQDYSDHPRKLITIRPGLKSTAAGRYQLLSRYYNHYKILLGLKDFSPASQDAIALQQAREQGAMGDIDSGNINAAIAKCANIWASFPGAGYGQHEHKLSTLRVAYLDAGGTIV